MTLPPHAIRPDYAGGSVLNLVATLGAHLGVPARHAPYRYPLPLAGVRQILLIVVDGLGAGQLSGAAARGDVPALAALTPAPGRVTSVFPSTTMAALTAIHTACAPGEHGYLGLTVWLEEAQATVNLIRLYDVYTHQPLEETAFLAAVPSLYRQLRRSGVGSQVIMPGAYKHSVLTRWACDGATYYPYTRPDEIPALTAPLLRPGEPSYTLVYFPDYDSLCHAFGPDSPEAHAELRRTDGVVARLLAALPRTGETLVLVTADHGQSAQPPEGYLDVITRPVMKTQLRGPVAGEERAAYLRPREAFRTDLEARLAPHATLLKADDAWNSGLFGPTGQLNPRFRSRVGDLIAVPSPGHALRRPTSPAPMLGLHGGWTPEEMLVPVLWARV
ncbi:alkaline phosphatase family protein [Deinococcus taeanensis]|uniref:alkaline phosphatase family protein n=1 Tax=Deinococcus taeanensis TaxID=2737050 RepID=UPI001CDBBDC4|nr:nucleotide pyrophosphatase/phosphodiesterase family protein [Deinococcus taeanensis]UBV41748.1 alkaline phosphatase family protein [Deinococcus taeanensis]